MNKFFVENLVKKIKILYVHVYTHIYTERHTHTQKTTTILAKHYILVCVPEEIKIWIARISDKQKYSLLSVTMTQNYVGTEFKYAEVLDFKNVYCPNVRPLIK